MAANPNEATVRGICVVLHEGAVMFDQNTNFTRDILGVMPAIQHPQNLTTGFKQIINNTPATNFFLSHMPTINFTYKLQWVTNVATGLLVGIRSLCTHATADVNVALAGELLHTAYVTPDHVFVTDAMRVDYALLDFVTIKAQWHVQHKLLNAGVNSAALQQQARDNHPLMQNIPTNQPCYQVVPSLYNNQGYDINSAVQDGYNVVLREKLLMFKTMNHVYPVDIYNRQFGEWWPLQLQDFNLRFEDDIKLQELIQPHTQIMHDGNPITAFRSTLVKTKLYIRSRDSGRQEDKPLDGLNYSHPLINRFRGVGAVECVASGVLPDLFFIYCEREYTPIMTIYQPPKVTRIRLKVRDQHYRMYEGEQIGKADIISATRRNSNKMADMGDLYKRFGGALLKVSDFGSLLDDQLQTFATKLKFTVDHEDEPILDNKDDEYKAHILLPVRTTVLFVFRDGVVLNGKYDQMEFRQTNL